MRGKSPFNKPQIRKTDVYRLLLKLGGEARWKDLKANLKQLGWGPTTLKQTLDDMVVEGSIIKEARLGAKGPEVWYKVRIPDEDIWKSFKERLERGETSPKQLMESIRDKAQSLKGEERKIFLKAQMRKIAELMMECLLAHQYMYVRGICKKIAAKDKIDIIANYLFDTIFKKEVLEYGEILAQYPEESMEVILELLKEIELMQ